MYWFTLLINVGFDQLGDPDIPVMITISDRLLLSLQKAARFVRENAEIDSVSVTVNKAELINNMAVFAYQNGDIVEKLVKDIAGARAIVVADGNGKESVELKLYYETDSRVDSLFRGFASCPNAELGVDWDCKGPVAGNISTTVDDAFEDLMVNNDDLAEAAENKLRGLGYAEVADVIFEQMEEV